MPYLFTCPHCQTQTLVDDEYSGQQGECVTCGKSIQLPHFSGTGNGGITTATTAGVPRNIAASRKHARWLIGGVLGAFILIGVLTLAVNFGGTGLRQLQANRYRGECMKNLEKIAKAMNAYARDYGSYPPPATVAADGTRLHSWRVLILPYLGYDELYNQFKLNEPWSSPTNQALLFEMPDIYRSPNQVMVNGGEASYYLITGAGTLFPPTGPLGPGNVIDDPTKTLLLIETALAPQSTSQWIEPGDIDISAISFGPGGSVGGNHVGGATTATVDGRAHWLRSSLEPAVLKALITPAGGEGLSDDVLQR